MTTRPSLSNIDLLRIAKLQCEMNKRASKVLALFKDGTLVHDGVIVRGEMPAVEETLLDKMRHAIQNAAPELFGPSVVASARLAAMATAAEEVARDYASEYAHDAVRDHEERR